MKRLLGVITLLLFVNILFAQPPITEQQAKAELERLGVDQDLVRKKMLERGIDIDNIDSNNPRQLLAAEKALEEVMAEIEADRAGETAPAPVNSNPQPVADQVIEDSTKAAIDDIKTDDQEVILSENLIEEFRDSLPPSTIYGQQVFRDKSLKLYRQSEDIKPPDSYILGVGDIVAISIWGISQEGAVYEINKSGYITPTQMPRIYLKGISYGKAKELLRKRFSNYFRFRAEEFEVSINYSRTITINIVGEAINFGSFTLPAINTAFNALVAAGGPSNIGSVRNIQLIRAGEQPRRIDIYEYLLNPSIQNEYYLQENDYINIPIAERLVTITGSVKKTYTYELIRGEELKKLLEFAGGFTDNAYQGKIQIKRYINDKEEIIDVDFRTLQGSRDFQLLSGDIVKVIPIAKPYKNFVDIDGAVEYPGRFELTNGMKVSDLIQKATLNEEARNDVAFIQRSNLDGTVRYERIDLTAVLGSPNTASNLVLNPKDKLIIYTKERFVDKALFSVVGAVRNPIKIPFSVGKEVKVEDAVLLAGGLRSDATPFAYIKRTDLNNSKKIQFIRVDLQKAISDPSTIENVILEPSDELIVYSTETFTDKATINVAGAVRYPREFQFANNFSLKDILTMAGGLKLEASQSRIEVFRVVFNGDQPTETIVATLEVDDDLNVISNGGDFDLEPFDLIVVRKVPEFELQNVITINGEVKYPGPYPLMDDNERLFNIIERAGGMTNEAFTGGVTLYRIEGNTGYIVVEMDQILKSKSARSNFILKKGDVINIPKRKDLVTIKGATKANEIYPDRIIDGGKLNVAYYKGKNAKWYVDRYAAGVGSNGQRKLITVEHPNGETERTKNFLFFKDYPSVREGSIVTVGVKPPKKKREDRDGQPKEKVDWARTLADGLAQATAVLSLILLVQQVNK